MIVTFHFQLKFLKGQKFYHVYHVYHVYHKPTFCWRSCPAEIAKTPWLAGGQMFRHKTKTGLNSSFVDRSACPAGEGWQITQCRRNLKGLRVDGRGIYAWSFFVFGGRGNFRTYVGHIGHMSDISDFEFPPENFEGWACRKRSLRLAQAFVPGKFKDRRA